MGNNAGWDIGSRLRKGQKSVILGNVVSDIAHTPSLDARLFFFFFFDMITLFEFHSWR